MDIALRVENTHRRYKEQRFCKPLVGSSNLSPGTSLPASTYVFHPSARRIGHQRIEIGDARRSARGQRPRRHGIHADAFGPHFLGQTQGKDIDGALGRGVVHVLARGAQSSGSRAEVDDDATLPTVFGAHAAHGLTRAGTPVACRAASACRQRTAAT